MSVQWQRMAYSFFLFGTLASLQHHSVLGTLGNSCIFPVLFQVVDDILILSLKL